ncbi:hypothetical protein J7E97_22370 [Streptomyces sp. ISL-66]|uniref:hypothetical protein n=1 Tax=Streptomyces sp. ISL-66 TaxID=2819186 RepID=UPI001BEA28F3|nr:hypothetical protein [Streptomyces sp. ISL-66]MBT2470539.1 hypothetical protein [Streptomyces sp. ISL-66]
MSDYAIPQAEPENGDGREAAETAEPQPVPFSSACEPAASPSAEEAGEADDESRAAESTAWLHTLLETAVTHRSVDEVADLVRLLRRSGQVPDAADQALRAAAISRPIPDVLSLVVLLAQDDEPQHRLPSEPHAEPQLHPDPQPEFEPQPRSEPAAEPGRAEPGRRSAGRGSRKRGDRPSREGPEADAPPTVPGRALRWPVAVALVVSALLYLPRDPSRDLVQGGGTAWLQVGLAAVCLALGVLVTVRDRVWVWSATTLTGIGLVSIHVLANVMGLDLSGARTGSFLPWPTGASMLAAGLTAILSVMALLYRSDGPQPAADLPLFVPPEAVPHPLDAPLDPTTDLAREDEVPAP